MIKILEHLDKRVLIRTSHVLEYRSWMLTMAFIFGVKVHTKFLFVLCQKLKKNKLFEF